MCDSDSEEASLIKNIKHLFGLPEKRLSAHLQDQEIFKEQVCKQLLIIDAEFDKLRDMFAVYEDAQKKKLKNKAVFAEQEKKQLYEELLNFEQNLKIMNFVENSM